MSLPGIYRITCLKTGKFYIGSSFNVNKRWYEHLWGLNNNRHYNKKMQRAFNKYGEASFSFDIIEYVDRGYLDIISFRNILVLEREQKYMNELLFADKDDDRFNKMGLNICRIANSQLGCRRSQECRMKMSIERTGRPNYRLRGKKQSDEHRKKLGEIRKGRMPSRLAVENSVKTNKGRKQTQNHIDKRVLLKTGVPNIKTWRPVLQIDKTSGIVVNKWNSLSNAARQLNIGIGGISSAATGRKKSFKGFKWQYQ